MKESVKYDDEMHDVTQATIASMTQDRAGLRNHDSHAHATTHYYDAHASPRNCGAHANATPRRGDAEVDLVESASMWRDIVQGCVDDDEFVFPDLGMPY